MGDLLTGLTILLLGAFLASNIDFLRKLLSLEEFFLGFWRGQAMGEKMKKGRRRKK